MLSHEELEAFAGAPELVDTKDELLQLIRHIRECTDCARTFKTALELEEKQLMPLRKEWRHLGERELRRLHRERHDISQSDCETAEALHLAFCADCAERYRRVAKSRSFVFRPLVATAAICVALVAGGLTWIMKHGSAGNPTAYRSAAVLGLSAPEDGSSLGVWDSFRWQPIAGASYELSIYDAKTDTVVLRRPTVTPAYVFQPEDADLFVGGNTYAWQVKAESASAGTLTSARRKFRFSGTEHTPQADAQPSYKDFPDDKRRKIAVQIRKGDDKIRRSVLQELQSYSTRNRTETTPDMAWALSEIALIAYYTEERGRCEEYYRNSLAVWKSLRVFYPFAYAKTLSNYGLALQDDGKFGEARQAYLGAANILRTQNTSASRMVLSDALLNLGTFLRSMGLYDEALKAQMETVDLDAKSDRPDKTIAVAQDFTDIGNTYADLKDLSTALQYLDRAFGVYMAELQLRKKQRRSLADLCEVYRALADDLGSLGDAYAATGNSKEAILRYSQTQLADERCHSQPHQIALTLNNIGELYIRHLNQPSEAQHYYERALPLVEKRSIDEAWRTYYGLGLVAFHTGRDADAETWFDKAIQAVETVSSSSPDVESQRHVWSNRTAPFYALALLRERRGSAVAALQAIELGRNRSLSETGLGKIASNTYQWDPRTTESGTIGLEYFFGEPDDPLLVVVVSRDGIQAHELGNGRTIEQLVTAANKALAVGRISELEIQLVELARHLLPPEVLTGLQNGSIARLVVSPDGALTQFPISALAIPERFGQHYLLDRADVTMVPSLGWWFKERHGSPTWPADDALVVADPIVDEVNGCAVPVNLLADLRSSTQTFPRLSFTAREAESVTRYASRHSLLLSAERATQQMLLSSSPFNFKILHFATHAHAGDDLWSSFIVLRCRGELDALAGREIPSLKLNGQLVVLSACGGSAGRSLSGMGSDSIASGFLMGGASAVVASHWSVEDKSTAQLMEAFYQELGNGTRVDHALRAAQLRLANSAPNSPRLWAAFEVVGDGDLVVPIQASLRVRGTTFSRRHWLILLLTGVALGGIAGAGLRKRSEGHGVKSN